MYICVYLYTQTHIKIHRHMYFNTLMIKLQNGIKFEIFCENDYMAP